MAGWHPEEGRGKRAERSENRGKRKERREQIQERRDHESSGWIEVTIKLSINCKMKIHKIKV